jgi:hypothetical protein
MGTGNAVGPTTASSRPGPLKAEGSLGEEDIGRAPQREGKDAAPKSDFIAKADSPDNLFIEDVSFILTFIMIPAQVGLVYCCGLDCGSDIVSLRRASRADALHGIHTTLRTSRRTV